jgi:ubiquinone/menaquinone biosynthesis C-methylase UbiE
MEALTIDAVAQSMSAHVALYSWHKPLYQHAALTNLRRLWNPNHATMLDVGGGTGVLAQTIKNLFGVRHVVSVDVEDRFLHSLDIETKTFDGRALPFPDNSFDCVLLFNVMHHVPITSRVILMRECRRVAGKGPIYIKDHISQGTIDDARLQILDLLGNVPFHGMLRARYLRDKDWRDLARATNHVEGDRLSGTYRSGAFEILFPNRLETMMRWDSR